MTFVETKFSRIEYKKIAKKELGKLKTTARDLFHFVNKFGKFHNVRDAISIYVLHNQIQKTEIDTCGIFQLLFYKNLFAPFFESLIVNDEKLMKNTVQKLLNEIFELDKVVNKNKMEMFIRENDMKFGVYTKRTGRTVEKPVVTSTT